jgi:hypothetical protein
MPITIRVEWTRERANRLYDALQSRHIEELTVDYGVTMGDMGTLAYTIADWMLFRYYADPPDLPNKRAMVTETP